MKYLSLAVWTLALFAIAAPPLPAAEPQTRDSRGTIGPQIDYAPAAERLQKLIAHEMREKGLPALSIALVDDGQVVWAAGFGMADPEGKVPATAETVYRVGSVSKLF